MPQTSALAHSFPTSFSATVKADTGTSHHYFKSSDARVLRNIRPISNGPSVLLPNGDTLQANKQAFIPINNNLSLQAQCTYIFPGLENSSLLSIGQLCDDNCQALFDKHLLHIFKNRKLILQGFRIFLDGLWDIHFGSNKPTQSTQQLVANAIIRRDKTKTELANFFHGCLFSPPLVTLQQALTKNYFTTWPGMNE